MWVRSPAAFLCVCIGFLPSRCSALPAFCLRAPAQSFAVLAPGHLIIPHSGQKGPLLLCVLPLLLCIVCCSQVQASQLIVVALFLPGAMETFYDSVTDSALTDFLSRLSVTLQRRMLRKLLPLESHSAPSEPAADRSAAASVVDLWRPTGPALHGWVSAPSASSSASASATPIVQRASRAEQRIRARGSAEPPPDPLPAPREADRPVPASTPV